MKKINFKPTTNSIIYISTLIISILILLFSGILINPPKSHNGVIYAKATVTDVLGQIKNDSPEEDTKIDSYVFKATITSGEHKDSTLEMTQVISDFYLPKPDVVKTGDKIIVSCAETDGKYSDWVYSSIDRSFGIILLVSIFILLILIIGRKKGVVTIVSLILTAGAIIFIYIPSILCGFNIYLMTILTAMYIIISSLILLNGWNKKTICTIVGNMGGLVVAGLLAVAINNILKITGYVGEDYMFLSMLNGVSIDLKGVVWGGIIIGATGAIMDVSMTISSAMQELSETMKNKSYKTMMKSGFNIGHDAIGTMTNTLILAYVGSFLSTILLFTANNMSPLYLFNHEMICVEIIQTIVGSIGILLAVPVTVLFCAWLYNKEPKSN